MGSPRQIMEFSNYWSVGEFKETRALLDKQSETSAPWWAFKQQPQAEVWPKVKVWQERLKLLTFWMKSLLFYADVLRHFEESEFSSFKPKGLLKAELYHANVFLLKLREEQQLFFSEPIVGHFVYFLTLNVLRHPGAKLELEHTPSMQQSHIVIGLFVYGNKFF